MLLETYPSMSSLLSWDKKYFSNRCYCFCESPPFSFEVWWNFPTDRSAVNPNSLPIVLVCAQGLRLTDSCEARGRLAVPVVVGLVDKSVLVTP